VLEVAGTRWQTSCKIEALLAELTRMAATPDSKGIVFSQWTSMLDLLEVPTLPLLPFL
jgi:hypothetical protein